MTPKKTQTKQSSKRPSRTKASSPARRSSKPYSQKFRSRQRVKKSTRPAPRGRTMRFDNKLKVTVLGGNEEVGRNMTVVEYGKDIIIIDMGLQFPEENMHGIDYIVPNISSLRGKEKNIRGVVITHGHYDHIGAIPILMPQLGNPPLYGTPITLGIIQKRQEDFRTEKLNLNTIKYDDVLTMGSFKVEFFHINHNIPQSVGVVVHTPVGTIVHTGDWKFDFNPVGEPPADFNKIARIGSGGVLALLSDSTNASQPGYQISETEIGKSLREIVKNAEGRVIAGTFSSLLSRVNQFFAIAEEFGKKVAIDGYSMKTNVEIARRIGYLKFKSSTLIDISKVDNYPKNKVIVVCTGAQGEDRAVLMRIANGEHRHVNVIPGDTIIFSSSVVPGNERTIQSLQDTLYHKKAHVFHYKMMDVHAGGHAKQEDIKLMLHLMKPKYFVPIEGNHFLLRFNAEVAKGLGYKDENIFIADNGQVMEFTKNSGKLTNKKVNTDYVMVDGLGVGDVSDVVLRDRQMLAEDGMVVVIVNVEAKTGRPVGSPDIVSRGFIHMKENRRLIDETKKRVSKLIQDNDPKSAFDENYTIKKLRDNVGQFLFVKTKRRPMVLPVIIEV